MEGTLENYTRARRYLAAFLQYEYKLEDIPFRELKRDFIEKYVVYLSTVRNMLPGSIHTPIKKLKLMSYTAFRNGWITSDPFAGFRINVTYRDRRFLSESELRAVMNVYVPNYKTAIVKDIFVFCCFTGFTFYHGGRSASSRSAASMLPPRRSTRAVNSAFSVASVV